MVLKIYGSIWILSILFVGVLYLAGLSAVMTGVVFGFLAFGLIWFGMLGILPILAEGEHHQAVEAVHAKPAPQPVVLKPLPTASNISPVFVSNQ